MLYDPKWERSDKTEAYSLTRLIQWLEQQPADKHYDIFQPKHCLLGQFARAEGAKQVGLMSNELSGNPGWDEIAFDGGANGLHTFGAALERARAALS